MSRRSPLAPLLARLPLVALLAAPVAADALSITGISVATTAADTAAFTNNAGNNRSQFASSVALAGASPGPVADVVGAFVGFDTRYASILAADREATTNTTTAAAVSELAITFTVLNPLGGTWQLDVDTTRKGALTLVDDRAAAGSGATATLGALSAFVDGVAAPVLTLAGSTLTGTNGGLLAFDQSSGVLSIVDTAVTRTFTLVFQWTSSVSSGQDEAAVRMGLAGGLSTTTADDYPGPGGRTLADDGQRVNVALTLLGVPIPEPGPAVLLGAGGAAAGARALELRRRRRRSGLAA